MAHPCPPLSFRPGHVILGEDEIFLILDQLLGLDGVVQQQNSWDHGPEPPVGQYINPLRFRLVCRMFAHIVRRLFYRNFTFGASAAGGSTSSYFVYPTRTWSAWEESRTKFLVPYPLYTNAHFNVPNVLQFYITRLKVDCQQLASMLITPTYSFLRRRKDWENLISLKHLTVNVYDASPVMLSLAINSRWFTAVEFLLAFCPSLTEDSLRVERVWTDPLFWTRFNQCERFDTRMFFGYTLYRHDYHLVAVWRALAKCRRLRDGGRYADFKRLLGRSPFGGERPDGTWKDGMEAMHRCWELHMRWHLAPYDEHLYKKRLGAFPGSAWV